MKSHLHHYYTRSSKHREMAYTKKSKKYIREEQSVGVAVKEDRQLWMNDPPIAKLFGDEWQAHEGFRSAWWKSTTPDRDSTLDKKFNELILTIHSMTSIMKSMERQIT